METKDRSTEAQKIIKNVLGEYFTEEQLSYLDDLGIEILADYFSKAELRKMSDMQPAVIKGMVDRNQSNEVKRRLTHIGVEELPSLMGWYEDNCSEVEEVYCPQSKEVIALEVKHKTLKNSPKVHWDGRFIVAIGDRLASTRTRLDGVVGYQCAAELLNPDFVPAWSKFYDERDQKLEAHRSKIEKHKAAYQKKVDKAQAAHDKKMDAYHEKVQKYGETGKGILPEQPVFVQPEYSEGPSFDEPVRPEDIPEHVPCLDTRWSAPETEVIPEDHVMSSITSSDIVEVKRHIDSTGYKKPVTKVKEGYKVDQFILRKVK